MKNKYIVQFETITGKTYFIRYTDFISIHTITSNEKEVYIFTNKEKARKMGKYFCDYVLSEYSTFKIYKIN